MKLSRQFLDDYVNTKNISNHDLAEKMTNVGNEYNEIREIATGTNLVIGEVIDCQMHPNSDHLHLCKVDIKTEVKQIVCGAPNVKKGIKVIVALPGAILPGGIIKKGVIRGEESDGMICSLAEIGLDSKYYTEEDKKGIAILNSDAKVGEDAKEYLGYSDTIIDFELTPNRADLLSVLGMAYEVGAILDEKVKEPSNKPKKEIEDINKYSSLKVDTKKCPLYLARMVKNVTIKESPTFIKERLMASGIRPINNVVDISNYVMLEYGQPLHFFDYKTLGNKIIVRMAKDNESFTTLDNIKRSLNSKDIVIANEKTPVALAGVMGGLNSEIEESTKDVVIESAIFDPVSIRKTARKILTSEASNRFERALDCNRTYLAIDRACYLLEKYANATVIKNTLVHDTIKKEDNIITITKEKIEKVLGFSLTLEEIISCFDRLGFITTKKASKLSVLVPSRRTDIAIEEDLIEEVGRIYGIDKVVGKLPIAKLEAGTMSYEYSLERKIREKLTAYGLNEVLTYTLVSEDAINKFQKASSYLEVLKPLSQDKKYIRNSIIPSLIDTYRYNHSRKQEVNIFEISNVYAKEGKDLVETSKLGILLSGTLSETKWLKEKQTVSFYLLKGMIETLLNYLGYQGRYSFNTTDLMKELHPYSSANILVDKELIGFIGRVNPKMYKEELYVCELNLTSLFSKKIKAIKNKEISKYPLITKDVAFVIDKTISAQEISDFIKKSANSLLTKLDIFDVYSGPIVPKNKKSIAFNLTFQSSDRTLEDSEVDKIFRDIISKVTVKYHAEIRDK